MNSGYTFNDEFDSLCAIPGVFYPPPVHAWQPSAADAALVLDRYGMPDAPLGVAPSPYAEDMLDAPSTFEVINLAILDRIGGGSGQLARPQTIDCWLEEELGLDIQRVEAEILGNAEEHVRIANRIASLGSESFGCYLPWHQFHSNHETPWGIYLFLENLLSWAGCLVQTAKRLGLALEARRAIQLAFHATYRHELFHFHVERFATRQEVLQRRPIYRPYDLQVFRDPRVRGTDAWLEEALAQAVVLESRQLRTRSGLAGAQLRTILEDEFLRFPPGYRDFRCVAFGGVAGAHRLFAAQIVTQSAHPSFVSTDLALPKLEYVVNDRIVPGYLRWTSSFLARFQFATPQVRKAKKWAERNGFVDAGPGPGDHKVWRHVKSGQRVQINARHNEIDFASLKALAAVAGKKVRDLRDEMLRA